jgi:hypothetical protein
MLMTKVLKTSSAYYEYYSGGKEKMKKVGVLIIVVILVVSSLMIGNSLNPVVIKADTQDRYPPQISAASPNPQTIGFGYNISISPTVTDNLSGVQLVKVNITYPDHTHENFTMSNKQGSTYLYNFSDTWQHGWYNYTVWAVDNANNVNSSSHHSFNVTAYATINVATLKDSYTDDEYINLSDPPNPPQNLTVVSRGLTWNTYYNASSGDNILEAYEEPVNYPKENGSWEPINNTFQILANNHPAYQYGCRVGNDHGLFGVYFKPNAQNSWPVAFAYNRSDDPTIDVLRSKLVGVGYIDPASNWSYQYLQNVQSSQGQLNGNTLTYPNVFTGVDISWCYGNTELKEAITMSNATKVVLQNHPPSSYGLHDTSSYLVFITKLDYQNLYLYNSSGLLNGNVTISEIGVEFRDALGCFRCALPLGDAYELGNESVWQRLTYRIVHLNGNTYMLSGLKLTDLNTMTFPVVIDPTLSVNSLTNDGYIYSSSTTYSTAWSASSGTVDSTSNFLSFGQKKAASFPPTYYIYRGFLLFNTSSLPSNAFIDNATLSLYKKDDYSTTDFTITVQNGQPTYPHNPLQAGDYAKGHYAGNGGGLNTSKFVNGLNEFGLTNLSWINKTGLTKLCLRSSRDINGTVPTANEYVNVYSANALDPNPNVSYKPKLIISYRNQSKIKNTGTTDMKGYLLIQMQYYCDSLGGWYVADDTIDETTPRTITAGGYLALDSIFNGRVNTSHLSYGNGSYRVYTALRDLYGNELSTSNGTLLKISYGVRISYQHARGWWKMFPDGFGKKSNHATRAMGIYPYTNGDLYVGTENHNLSKIIPRIINGFPEGTRITMADNSYKTIENIQTGDHVKAYNIDNRRYVSATVTSVHQSSSAPDFSVNINNNKIHASPGQIFMADDSFVEAADLQIGDHLVDVNGSQVIVNAKSNVTNLGYMFGFTIGISPYLNVTELNNLTFFAENLEVYPWTPNVSANNWECIDSLFSLLRNCTNRVGTLACNVGINVIAALSDGCDLWRYNKTTGVWTPIIGDNGIVMKSGFNNSMNWVAGAMTVFTNKTGKTHLYVSTWRSQRKGGCEIWRYDGTSWEKVVGNGLTTGGGFGDPYNIGVMTLAVFTNKTGKTHLYAGTVNFNWENDGFCQVWRSDDGVNWQRVINRGFRDVTGVDNRTRNAYAWSMAVFKNKLYVGIFNIPVGPAGARGCQLFCSDSGNANDWQRVLLNNSYYGFNEIDNFGIRGLINWSNQYLYVGVAVDVNQLIIPGHIPEALEIWNYSGSTWKCMAGDDVTHNELNFSYDGFGNYWNKYPWSMSRCLNNLWVGTANGQRTGLFKDESEGCEVWHLNGTNWYPVVKDGYEKPNGFGQWQNSGARSMIEFPKNSGRLVVGTFTPSGDEGCEIWIRYP